MLPRSHQADLLGQDQAEQIRSHVVSRVLKRMDLSPEEAETVEQLSRSLVAQLITGPIAAARARGAEQAFHKEQGNAHMVSKKLYV